MLKRVDIILLFAFIVIIIASCKKDFEGDAKQQQPPETYMVVDKISRTGEQRYTTTIEAHWWGASNTGIIKGFETSIDNQQTWQFTKNQSGSFLLTLPPGKDTADIVVYVRAVDNLDQRDPTPASTAYPIKNTPPAVYIDYSNGRPANTLPAFRYYWNASDTDGTADIQGIEVGFNDTNNLYLLPGNTTAASFVAEMSGGSVTNSFEVYQNTRTVAQSDKLTGIIYDQYNKFYIRAFDRTGSRSGWATDSIYIRKPKSDMVLVNHYSGGKNIPQNFYTSKLNAMGAPYNLYDIIYSPIDELPTDNFTSVKLFGFYKKIIWFSNDPNATLSLASQNTSSFFYNGGKMLMVIDIGGGYSYTESQVSFTPIASFVTPPNPNDQFKMDIGDSLVATKPGWPALVSSSGILNISLRPYELQGQSGLYAFESLYNGRLTLQSTSSRWTGQSLLISKRTNISDGATNMIFSAIPLNLMQGDPAASDSVFKKMIIDELKF